MKSVKWIALVTFCLFLGACALNDHLTATIDTDLPPSDHYDGVRFFNSGPFDSASIGTVLTIMWRKMTGTADDAIPAMALPIIRLTRADLDALSDDTLHLIKLGHSSMLLKIDGRYWLIDPVFSDRASPVSFAGPKRFHPPPITIDELPPIERVLISHNHYDHLDQSAIRRLAAKTGRFLVPLGVDGALLDWGVEREKISTFDWWQELESDGTRVALTPSLHFSGRSLTDRDKTLWGSWVIQTSGQALFFSGDSGYFDGFKAIGEKYGPFDLTLIETGAYSSTWPRSHMFPEQSVQAHRDLGGRVMLPIHNSTFDLAFHPWYEPLERVAEAAARQSVQLTTPLVGEVFTALQDPVTERWWRSVR